MTQAHPGHKKLSGQKKGIFEKVLKKISGAQHLKAKEDTNYEIRQGIVKEIIVRSPLEDKMLEYALMKKPAEEKKEDDFRFDKIKKPAKEEERKESTLTLLIIPSEEYTKNIYFLSKHLSDKYERILYVSLNELYQNIATNFRTRKINISKFYFIDAITNSAETNPQKRDNCTFVVSPNSLVELSLAISSAIEARKPQVVLFDSLSTLLIYENPKTAVKFVHSFIGKIKAAGVDAFLTALEGDSQSQAIKDLGMFVDDYISFDKFRMYRIELELGPEKKREK